MKKYINEKLKEERRKKWCIWNKIPHFAPTISPAPKNMEKSEIESVSGALEYYRENGVNEVIVQTKYMGSYCDIELHKDITQSRLFSRNANLINYLDQNDVIEALKDIHLRFDWENLNKVLIQAELMPWSALGKNLIENEFKSYLFLVENHIEALEKSSIMGKMGELLNSPFYAGLAQLPPADLKQHERKNLETLKGFNYIDTQAHKTAIELYRKQIAIYGGQGKLHFKPFNVLKYYWAYGTETVNRSNVEGFEMVSDDFYIVVSTDKSSEATIKALMGSLVDQEGIVIKPTEVFTKGVCHALKIRSHKYLHLIYGVNFGIDYQYYLGKRNIKRKMLLQQQQWEIAQNMLLLPENEINDTNERYLSLLNKRFESERRLVELDSRL